MKKTAIQCISERVLIKGKQPCHFHFNLSVQMGPTLNGKEPGSSVG